MAEIAGWATLGLIAGALARWIVPGQSKGGWFGALVLGIIGALIGGWVARSFGLLPEVTPGEWLPEPRSLVSATVGAIGVLALWRWFAT